MMQIKLGPITRLAACFGALVYVGFSAAADRERPVIVHPSEELSVDEALQLWTAGLARPFDTIALPPGTVPEKELSEGNAGWWSADIDALREAVAQDKADKVHWVIYDMSRPEALSPEARTDVEKQVRGLAEAAQRNNHRFGVVMDHDLATTLIPNVAPYVNLCIVEMPQPSGDLAEEARQFAIAVNEANRRSRVGVYFPPAAPGAPYDTEAFLAFYEGSHEFLHYYAVQWPADTEAFGRFLTTVNAEAPGAGASQGMYADTMQAPAQSLDPQVEQRLRMVLIPTAIIFVVALAAFIYFYARPARKPQNPRP